MRNLIGIISVINELDLLLNNGLKGLSAYSNYLEITVLKACPYYSNDLEITVLKACPLIATI